MAEGFMNQVVLDGTSQCGSHEEQAIQVRSPIWGRRNSVAVSTVDPAAAIFVMKDVLIQIGHVACDVLIGCCLAAATLLAVDLVMPKDAADEKKATSFSKTTPTKTKTPQKGTSFQKDTTLVGTGI